MSIIKTNSIINDLDGSTPTTIDGVAVDGSSAVAVVINAASGLNASGSKIVSIQNAGTEVASIDKDGNFSSSGSPSTFSVSDGTPGHTITLDSTGNAFGGPAIEFGGQGKISCSDNLTMALDAPSQLQVTIHGSGVNQIQLNTATLDLTGLGAGGSIKLKSPDGTTYTITVANGGTIHIV